MVIIILYKAKDVHHAVMSILVIISIHTTYLSMASPTPSDLCKCDREGCFPTNWIIRCLCIISETHLVCFDKF